MPIPYPPDADDALSDAAVFPTLEDPGSLPMEDLPDIVSCLYTFKPLFDETLALIKSQVARQQYRRTYTCIAGLSVGDPVYISADNTVTKASSTSSTTAKVIGFCAYKPTTTTCYISHYYYKSGLSGLTANNPVYLDASGVVNAAPSAALVGSALSTTEALLIANPIPNSLASGAITSITFGAGLSGGTITSSGTVSQSITTNAQTGTTYTYLSTDAAKLVTHSNASSIAATLPQATGSFTAGWFMDVENKGAGLLTITPTTSTINGAATLTLAQNQGCRIVSDGTNYQVVLGKATVSSLSGLGTGVATFLATPSSANLLSAITDETGTGALVFATSPTLVTPLLGTPTSGNLANCTGYTVANLSGLGSGVGTFLTTPSSANLLAAVTDETGTGALVFATSPTLVTPILGTPTSGNLANTTNPPVTESSLRHDAVGAASISALALTVAIKRADGTTDGAAATPIKVAFRSATLSTAGYNVRSITAALSATLSTTQSMGIATGAKGRIWFGLLDNAGTPEVWFYNPLNGTDIKRIWDGQIVTTTTAGTTAQTFTSTTARSSVPIKILGYFEATWTNASGWSALTVNQTYETGMPLPGQVLNYVRVLTAGGTTGTTTVPSDNTTPLVTEGDQYQTLTVTPVSALNVVQVNAQGFYASSAPGNMAQFICHDGSNALAVQGARISVADDYQNILTSLKKVVGTAASTTFTVRAGQNNAATTSFNARAGTSYYNSTLASYVEYTEFMV